MAIECFCICLPFHNCFHITDSTPCTDKVLLLLWQKLFCRLDRENGGKPYQNAMNYIYWAESILFIQKSLLQTIICLPSSPTISNHRASALEMWKISTILSGAGHLMLFQVRSYFRFFRFYVMTDTFICTIILCAQSELSFSNRALIAESCILGHCISHVEMGRVRERIGNLMA